MAVGDARVFPGSFTPVLTQLFFPKPPTTFLTCFCRGERRKYAGKKFASTGDRTHNHQVMSPIRSTPSHPGGAATVLNRVIARLRKMEVVLLDTRMHSTVIIYHLSRIRNFTRVMLFEKGA